MTDNLAERLEVLADTEESVYTSMLLREASRQIVTMEETLKAISDEAEWYLRLKVWLPQMAKIADLAQGKTRS